MAYMDTASQLLKEAGDAATRLSPPNASDRIELFRTIGDLYRRKYDATNLMSDLESAMSFLGCAFILSPVDTDGDLMTLISIAQSFASALMLKEEWDTAFKVIHRVVPMIATTMPRFLDISETQALLSRHSCLASDGAALAVSTGRHPVDAIRLLEAGRGVSVLTWNELRYDMTFLRSLGKDTQDELLAIREELDSTLFDASHVNDASTQLCEEVKAVLEAFKPLTVKLLQLDQRTKKMVQSLLRDSDIFHFAGHGYTDDTDPSQSHLRLQDWQEDPLTVADLIAMNLREQNPFLAYLGACGTGQIEEAKHLDESVHLISACQLAGFRHVVGTLCKVNDETCVEIARITYEVIRDRGMSEDSVSEGLHHATRELRDRWRDDWQGFTRGSETKARGTTVRDSFPDEETGGDKRYARRKERSSRRQGRDASPYESDEDDYQARPLQWAPHVHYGC
ncbi:hypothetical protein CDV31_013286 [Fusarium ambrosium]|uniref:CHAT domain-containing protein n=1 Tax=Fusarium ambrosium TaxID=131363 RepID=A0A428T467_9HYPO|nr:hypothetical protein CDV31_013286 [Fusarium ambrosium]